MAQKTGALILTKPLTATIFALILPTITAGLHCGECMDVFTGGKWKPTRIEYGDNWYLVGGIRAEDLNGLRVMDLTGRRKNGRPLSRPKAACHPNTITTGKGGR